MSHVCACPHCAAGVRMDPSHAGRTMRCPRCREMFTAPMSAGSGGDAAYDSDPWQTLEQADYALQPLKPTLPGVTFRFACDHCRHELSAPLHQVGQTIECGRCHQRVGVPSPQQAGLALSDQGPENPWGFEEGNFRGFDNPIEDTDAVFRRASETSDEERYAVVKPQPGPVGWIKAVAWIFVDPGVMLHLLATSTLLGIFVAILFVNPRFSFGILPFVAVMISLAIACAVTLIDAVGNGMKSIDDWPTMDLFQWVESVLLVGAAALCSLLLPTFLSTFVFAKGAAAVALVLGGAHLVFPFVLLSMMDNQSLTAPFSMDVVKSYLHCPGSCIGFYATSTIVLACIPVYFFFAPLTPIAIGVGASVSVVVAFLYAVMLGRMAYAFAHFQNEPDQEEGEAEALVVETELA